MFTFHLNRDDVGNETRYWRGFRVVHVDEAAKIAKLVTSFVTSPIRWRDGIRKKVNFVAANWIGLDFDKGIVLADIVETFQKYTHVIGTTKHHQLPKGNEAAKDRCRVFLRLPVTITSCKDYEEIVRYYVSFYKSDWQAIDGARKFNPCREIVSVVEGETVPAKKKPKKTYAQRVEESDIRGVPRWVSQLLKFGVGFGQSRNTACYKIAVHLKKAGLLESQVVDILMNSQVPMGPEVREEVETAVKSGFR